MKKATTVVIVLCLSAVLAFLFISDNTTPAEDKIDEFEETGDNNIAGEEDGLPARLNLQFPDSIEDPYNPCYSLEVDNDIRERRHELSEYIKNAEENRERVLRDRELPLEVFRGDDNRKEVALTIDTGVGGKEGIEQILKLSEHYNIDLTFFVTGCWALENPELLQHIFLEGHSVGNHSLTHLNLSGASGETVKREISETGRIIEETLGIRPYLFRKPQYAGGQRITEMAGEMGYISVQGYPDLGDTAGWHPDSTPESVLRRVERGTQPGAIWVFHNLSLSDLRAFEDIIRFHLKEGYKLVSVDTMLKN